MKDKIGMKLDQLIDGLYQLNDRNRHTILFLLGMIQALFAFAIIAYMQLIIPAIICLFGIVTFIGAFRLSKKMKIHLLYNCILIYAFLAEIIISFYIDSSFGFQNYLFVILLMSFTFLYTQKSYRDLISHTLRSFILIAVGLFICNAVDAFVTHPRVSSPAFVLFVSSVNDLLVLCLIFMYTLIFVIKLIQLRTQVEIQNKEQIDHQQLSLKLAQIKPHFMYNTLTCITTLIDSDPTTARQLLFYFSQYMRANIDSLTDRELIPFSEELAHALTYVDITSICFKQEIQLELNLEKEDFLIPPLTLQPIVENAIKHGELAHHPQSIISIRSWMEASQIVVQITDNGIGFDVPEQDKKEGSVGLKNVAFRLQTLCAGSLEIDSTSGKGTAVTLLIPVSGLK